MSETNAEVTEIERLRAENEELRKANVAPEPAIPYEEDPRFAAGAAAQTKRAVELAQLQLDGLDEKRAKLEKQLAGVDKSIAEAKKTHSAAVKEKEKWAKISDKLGNPNGESSESVTVQPQIANGSGEALTP